MNRDIAIEINKVMVDGYAMLHASIDSMRRAFSRERSKSYCAVVGRVLGHMLLDVMDPIYKEHPALVPHYLSEEAEEASGEMEMEIDSTNIFLLRVLDESVNGLQTPLLVLVDNLTIELERTVSIVRGNCQGGEADEYDRHVAAIIALLNETRAHIMTSNTDVGVPHDPLPPAPT